MNTPESTQKFEIDTNLDKFKQKEYRKRVRKQKKEERIELPSEALNTLPYMDDNDEMAKMLELYKQKTDFDAGVRKQLFASLQDEKYSKEVKEHLPTSDDVIDYLHGWNNSPRNARQIDAEPPVPRGGVITLQTFKKKSLARSSNFTLSKTSTGISDAELMRRQRIGKLKKIDVLRYGAEHFYNSSNMENILHEKDGVISKMKQFDYKVHRPIDKSKIKKKQDSSIIDIQKH